MSLQREPVFSVLLGEGEKDRKRYTRKGEGQREETESKHEGTSI